MPCRARRFRLGVRHSDLPAMVAHCCWSDMMCRMLGRSRLGVCASAFAVEAPASSWRRFSMGCGISLSVGGQSSDEVDLEDPAGGRTIVIGPAGMDAGVATDEFAVAHGEPVRIGGTGKE